MTVAVLLAALGTFVLLSYVNGADERALAGTRTVEVLVVSAPIPAGTSADDLADLVTTTPLPSNVVLTGGVTSLDDLEGRVATVDLEVGEQLLDSRFISPADLQALDEVEIPAGLHEITIALEPQRVIGGEIAAGDTVGVFLSDMEGKTTHLVLHKALVTNVQGLSPVLEPEGDTPVAEALPPGDVMVTLALDAPSAEKLVFGMEQGMVWLSAEPLDADENGTIVLDWNLVYQ